MNEIELWIKEGNLALVSSEIKAIEEYANKNRYSEATRERYAILKLQHQAIKAQIDQHHADRRVLGPR